MRTTSSAWAPAIYFVLVLLSLSALSFAGLKWAPTQMAVPAAGPPIFSSSSIYLVSQDGRLNIFDLASGTPKSPYSLSGQTHVSPISAGSLIITGTDDGRIEALSLEQMRRVWVYPAAPLTGSGGKNPPNGVNPKPANQSSSSSAFADSGFVPELRTLVYGGSTVYAIGRNQIIALDSSSGFVKKIFSVGDSGAAAADSARLYVMDGDTLKAFSSDGGLVWSLQTGKLYQTSPSVDEASNRVYAATINGFVMSIRISDGQVMWQYPLNGWPMATPLPTANGVMVGANDGRLRALDRLNGTLLWMTDLHAPIRGQISEVKRGTQRILLVPTQAPSLAAVDEGNGALLWDYPLADWPYGPSVSDDGRYAALTTHDKQLYLITLSPMCTIDSPKNQQLIAPFAMLSGHAWAWGGANHATLSVQGRDQEIAVDSSGMFGTTLDLTQAHDGSIGIRCLAQGNDGSVEVDNGPAKSAPILSASAPAAQMNLTAPAAAEPGGQLRVYVRNPDAYDMTGVMVEFMGKTALMDSPITLIAPTAEGAYNLTVSKQGFADQTAVIRVQTDRRPLIIGGIVAFVAVVAIIYFVTHRKKRVAAPTDYSRIR